MKLMPSQLVCRQAVELMSDYIEGSLPRRERRRLEKHLKGCDVCSTYLEQLRATIAASGKVVPEDLAPEVIETFTDLFRRFASCRPCSRSALARPGSWKPDLALSAYAARISDLHTVCRSRAQEILTGSLQRGANRSRGVRDHTEKVLVIAIRDDSGPLGRSLVCDWQQEVVFEPDPRVGVIREISPTLNA
jgi:hypothetical protein